MNHNKEANSRLFVHTDNEMTVSKYGLVKTYLGKWGGIDSLVSDML